MSERGRGGECSPGADGARQGLGLPAELFYVSEDVRAYFAAHKKRLARRHSAWRRLYESWKKASPQRAALLESAPDKPSAAHLL